MKEPKTSEEYAAYFQGWKDATSYTAAFKQGAESMCNLMNRMGEKPQAEPQGNDEDMIIHARALKEYCGGFKDCEDGCIFYNDDSKPGRYCTLRCTLRTQAEDWEIE